MAVHRLLSGLAVLLSAAPAVAAPAAPAFTITVLDDSRTLDSRAFLGKSILVVRFQASWCKVCVAEAPGLERIYEKYRGRGVEVVGIQVQDTAVDARRFLQDHRATYAAGLDPKLKIANRFGFKGTPYTVIINTRGEMVARIHGSAGEARLSRVLDSVLAGPAKRRSQTR